MLFTGGRKQCVLQLFTAEHGAGNGVPVDALCNAYMRQIQNITNSSSGQVLGFYLFFFIILEVVVKIKHGFEIQAWTIH